MFDIIRCSAEPSKSGFERFFSFDTIKSRLIEAENLAAATDHKNKRSLILLRDYAIDDGAIKIIAEKKALCFLIDLSRIIRTRGVPRAIMLSKLRNFLRLCVKYGAFYAFASFAEDENKIRNASELENIALLLDINRGQAKFALKMLKEYLQ